MSAFLAVSVNVNKNPCEGPKTLPIVCDFSIASVQTFDFTTFLATGAISGLQGVFIDNADNGQKLTLTINSTGQRIVCPANSQGFFPLFMQPGNGQIAVTCTGGNTSKIYFYNTPIMPAVWFV